MQKVSMANAVDEVLRLLEKTNFSAEDSLKCLNYCKTKIMFDTPFEEVAKMNIDV